MKTYIQNTILQQTNSMPFVLPISKAKTPIFPFYAPKQTQGMSQISNTDYSSWNARQQKGFQGPQLGSCQLPFGTSEMILFFCRFFLASIFLLSGAFLLMIVLELPVHLLGSQKHCSALVT